LYARPEQDPEITREGDTITGEISAARCAAFYGVIHQRGGSHPYTIQPVNKGYLRAIIGGKEVFRKKIEHPPLPQRPWFDSAVEEMREEFIAGGASQ
jgi:hypothetical protein